MKHLFFYWISKYGQLLRSNKRKEWFYIQKYFQIVPKGGETL